MIRKSISDTQRQSLEKHVTIKVHEFNCYFLVVFVNINEKTCVSWIHRLMYRLFSYYCRSFIQLLHYSTKLSLIYVMIISNRVSFWNSNIFENWSLSWPWIVRNYNLMSCYWGTLLDSLIYFELSYTNKKSFLFYKLYFYLETSMIKVEHGCTAN